MRQNEKNDKDKVRKSWKLQPPENVKESGTGRWQPERLKFSEGIRECPRLALIAYALLLIFSLGFHIYAYNQLPDVVTVSTWFELGQSSFPRAGFLAVSFGILPYMIYRDLIHRSMSQYLLVMPAIYCAGSCFLVSSLLI